MSARFDSRAFQRQLTGLFALIPADLHHQAAPIALDLYRSALASGLAFCADEEDARLTLHDWMAQARIESERLTGPGSPFHSRSLSEN